MHVYINMWAPVHKGEGVEPPYHPHPPCLPLKILCNYLLSVPLICSYIIADKQKPVTDSVMEKKPKLIPAKISRGKFTVILKKCMTHAIITT